MLSGKEESRPTEIASESTQRQQAEEWLRASEARLRAVVSSIDDIVFEIDEQGTYVNVWTGNERLLVRPRAELIGHRLQDRHQSHVHSLRIDRVAGGRVR